MQWTYLAGAASVAALGFAFAGPSLAPGAPAAAQAGFDTRCTALTEAMRDAWPEKGTRITAVDFRAAGPAPAQPGPPGMAPPPAALPAHCEIVATMHERQGVDGQRYAIRFHLRLPQEWNGRFFFEGGGGTNGELGSAIGRLSGDAAPALAQGYAVLSQDSGHDNATNSDPKRGGATAFGFDPQARADYGGASLAPVTLAAKALVTRFYGSAPKYSYFVGCSKGGQEGMMLAQRHPELYDGIVAAAPGFALPRAALAEAWDTQQFASVVKAKGETLTLASLAASFSDADLGLVRKAVLDACDADDGLADGIVGAQAQCTSAKVVPVLRGKVCSGDKQAGCLSTAQIGALEGVHGGPKTSAGKPLYAGFPWDAGWSDMGWRIWKIGLANGQVPSINVMMGVPALATTFTVPPKAPGIGPDALLGYATGFDFDRDADAIYATGGGFARSGWQDIGARSTDLSAFRKRGGRMIVPHGGSDPVFSVADTIDWWKGVDRANRGAAAGFVRVFPVPGMGHCQGGPATDRFDAFAALVRWVEQGKAPERIEAAAGPMSPWKGRTRPLCPYPLVAVPKPGAADSEKAENFVCARR
ncbi:tannase/feruloyl esterase family alpha/beta hydrolase [Sphingomonas hengshuiensis]|uniref:tannase/feruloyl esterase family alpha/beta hydrolase n=1 Tax=Sphingomonas hengshuiensis TaxID=1609977 RepID=UPI0005C84D5F|nr:tannase/feruloyl esterase family alpha/beta hydrolase [Sphingomonas hengshuiensis]